MPGLDLSQLSSNWKKLRGKLQSENKPEGQENGLKRKREEEKSKTIDGRKKARLADRRPNRTSQIRRMGMNGSKPEAAQDKTQNGSKLVNQHGISREDISAAYGNPEHSPRTYNDEVNGGLQPSNKVGKYIALDCEMVGTGPPPHLDNILARVSLVNFHGEQIYDSYVLPPPGVEVKDYRTFVSGIRPQHLRAGCARPLTDVQREVDQLLNDRILVGHAVGNDLTALLLSHPKRDLRDTSRYPKFRERSMGKPPALRLLAKEVLGLEIQSGEHSSIEDARAAMMLFRNEKVGFEEEARKRFGRRTKVEGKGGKKVNGSIARNSELSDDDEDEDAEEDDEELLAGEEDASGDEVGTSKSSIPKAKKKRKKKKRTKRK